MKTRWEETVPKSSPRAGPRKPQQVSIIWIVPAFAALAAGWLVYDRVRTVGPSVTVNFDDGQGLQAGQTAVRYRGVKIGDLRAIALSADAQHVEARIRLDRSAKNLARQGALFWVVRPEVGAGGLKGLDTLMSGVYIQAQPGSGKEQKTFTGLEHPPMIPSTKGGLEITLLSSELGSLSVGAPVYYRGLEVGAVEFYSLSDDATRVKTRVRIDSQYAPLVTDQSVFWNAGGLSVRLKFIGIDIGAESIKSLLTGGVAFATPPVPGRPAAPGSVFVLHEKAEEKWQKWTTPLPGWDRTAKSEGNQ
jgi:paraquat-inducible protein B